MKRPDRQSDASLDDAAADPAGTSIRRLPRSFTVGTLFMENNPMLEDLPDDLVVKQTFFCPLHLVARAYELRRCGQIGHIGHSE